MMAAVKALSAQSIIRAPSKVSISAFSPSVAHTFLFLSASHSFLLEARHLGRMLRQLWVVTPPPMGQMQFAWWFICLLSDLAGLTLQLISPHCVTSHSLPRFFLVCIF